MLGLSVDDILKKPTVLNTEYYFISKISDNGNLFAFSFTKSENRNEVKCAVHPETRNGEILVLLGEVVKIEGQYRILSELPWATLLSITGMPLWNYALFNKKDYAECITHAKCPGVKSIRNSWRDVSDKVKHKNWTCSLPPIKILSSKPSGDITNYFFISYIFFSEPKKPPTILHKSIKNLSLTRPIPPPPASPIPAPVLITNELNIDNDRFYTQAAAVLFASDINIGLESQGTDGVIDIDYGQLSPEM